MTVRGRIMYEILGFDVTRCYVADLPADFCERSTGLRRVGFPMPMVSNTRRDLSNHRHISTGLLTCFGLSPVT